MVDKAEYLDAIANLIKAAEKVSAESSRIETSPVCPEARKDLREAAYCVKNLADPTKAEHSDAVLDLIKAAESVLEESTDIKTSQGFLQARKDLEKAVDAVKLLRTIATKDGRATGFE